MQVEIYDIIMHIINLFSTCSQKKKSGKSVFKRNSKDFLVGNINQFLFKDKQTYINILLKEGACPLNLYFK